MNKIFCYRLPCIRNFIFKFDLRANDNSVILELESKHEKKTNKRCNYINMQ